MRQPPFLHPGDTIGLISTARKINAEELEAAYTLFDSWQLNVCTGKTIGASDHQFAGNDALRTHDLQTMMDNPEIKAIVCARGGYGTVRILDGLSFQEFVKHPKWIVGYSDVTVLHAHINTYLAIQTIHSTMPVNFSSNTPDSLDSLRKALFGEPIRYSFPSHVLNRSGEATGEIVGGNLSILYSILGTKSGIRTDKKILFIEDLDEYLYHIDRMVVALKRAGKFDQISGLIVGGMTDMNDNTIPFGQTAEEIIAHHIAAFPFPVCFGFPAGHIENNSALYLGKEVHLSVQANECSLSF